MIRLRIPAARTAKPVTHGRRKQMPQKQMPQKQMQQKQMQPPPPVPQLRASTGRYPYLGHSTSRGHSSSRGHSTATGSHPALTTCVRDA
ncbi:MAG: hypothetical protein U0939_12785 [Pirellulales bacterium]